VRWQMLGEVDEEEGEIVGIHSLLHVG
jgi:hypothetical protein